MLPFPTPQAQSQQQRRPQPPNDYVHRAPFFPPQQHPPFLTPAQQFEQMNHHNHHPHHHHQQPQQPPLQPQQPQQQPPQQQQQQQPQQQQQQQHPPQQQQHPQPPPPSRTPRPQQRPQQPIAPRPPQLDSVPPPQQSIAISRHPSLGQGQGLIRLLQFSGMLSSELKTKLHLSWWNDLIKEYFTPKAFMKLTLWKDNQRKEAKPFEIGVPILPRFFLVTTQSGVRSMSLSLDGARERCIATGHCIVECVAAIWTYRYTNGYTVTLRGTLSAHVIITSTSAPGSAGQPSSYAYKFDEFTFDASFHDKFIALDAINGQRTPEVTKSPWIRSASTPNANGLTDPALSAEDDKKWEEPKILIENCSIPGEPVNAFGIPQATMRCLELAESVGAMADLIVFSNEAQLGPLEALKSLAGKIREGNPPNLHPPDSGLPVTTATGIAAATGTAGINGYHQHPLPLPPPHHGPPFNPAPHTLYSGLPPPNQGQPGQGGSGGSSIAPSPAAAVNSPQTRPGSGMNSPQKVHKNIPPPIGGHPGQMGMQQQHQQLSHPPSQVQTPVTPAMHSASLHGNMGGMSALGGMGGMGNMGNPGMNMGGGMGNMGGGGMGGMPGGTPIMGPSTTPVSINGSSSHYPAMVTGPGGGGGGGGGGGNPSGANGMHYYHNPSHYQHYQSNGAPSPEPSASMFMSVSARTPTPSSGTANTPLLPNATLKRKQQGPGQEMINHASPSMATQAHPSATPQQQVQGMVGVGMMVGGGEQQQQQQQKRMQRKRGRTGTSGAG